MESQKHWVEVTREYVHKSSLQIEAPNIDEARLKAFDMISGSDLYVYAPVDGSDMVDGLSYSDVEASIGKNNIAKDTTENSAAFITIKNIDKKTDGALSRMLDGYAVDQMTSSGGSYEEIMEYDPDEVVYDEEGDEIENETPYTPWQPFEDYQHNDFVELLSDMRDQIGDLVDNVLKTIPDDLLIQRLKSLGYEVSSKGSLFQDRSSDQEINTGMPRY